MILFPQCSESVVPKTWLLFKYAQVANFSLQVGHCMGERGELWRELFGHKGADGVLVAYDETQKPVVVTQSWLYTGCQYARATSKARSLKEVV